MDANAMMTAISNVGFPIAMCLMMGWYVYTTTKAHADEVGKLADVINQNTDAIAKLQTTVETILRMRSDTK